MYSKFYPLTMGFACHAICDIYEQFDCTTRLSIQRGIVKPINCLCKENVQASSIPLLDLRSYSFTNMRVCYHTNNLDLVCDLL